MHFWYILAGGGDTCYLLERRRFTFQNVTLQLKTVGGWNNV